jgi:hypothetical protein
MACASEATATPRHSGKATKKTTMDAGMSFAALEKSVLTFIE